MPLFPGRFQQLFRNAETVASQLLSLAVLLTNAPVIQTLAAQDESATRADSKRPSTEQEANEFANRMAETIQSDDIEDYNKLIDCHALLLKASKAPISPKLAVLRKSFAEAAVLPLSPRYSKTRGE